MSDDKISFDFSNHKLVYVPHVALENQTTPFTNSDIAYRKALSMYMQDMCVNHNGLGLAANQISLDAAVFVTHIQQNLVTMINPTLDEVSDDKVLMTEGCLSDPGLYLKISRPDMIKVSWDDELTDRCEATLYGIDARVFLHEYDHLQGILFTDRVGKTKLHMARKKQARAMERAMQRIMDKMN
jgi:peptide deformylase